VRNPAGAAAVETEGKLLEVAVEMFEAHRPLMGAEDPSLEQREDQMNAGQHLGRGLIELGQHRDDVAIAGLAELGIAAPAVGVSGFAIAEVAADEGGEDIGRNIGDHTEANPATALATLLHRGGDDGFILGGPTRFAGFRTADVALVDLDLAGQGLPIGPNHGGADLGEPGPGRLIAAEPELALQFGGRDTLLRRRDFEEGPEPQHQRLLALFEDRPGDDRNLPATAGALVDHPLRRQEVGSVTGAVGAAEALRPFQPSQVLTTPVVVSEPGSELSLGVRKFEQVHQQPRTSGMFSICSYLLDTPMAT